MTGSVRKSADGSWVADVTINGTRRTGKCKTRSEALARKRELLELLMQREAKPSIRPVFTMKEARALSMRIRWAGLAYERTAAIYSAEAVSYFGDHLPINEITAALVDGWRQKLLAKGNRPAPSTGRCQLFGPCFLMPTFTAMFKRCRACLSSCACSTPKTE